MSLKLTNRNLHNCQIIETRIKKANRSITSRWKKKMNRAKKTLVRVRSLHRGEREVGRVDPGRSRSKKRSSNDFDKIDRFQIIKFRRI